MRSEGLILLEDRLEDIKIFIIILCNEGEMKIKILLMIDMEKKNTLLFWQ